MSELRQKMIRAMELGNLSDNTQRRYLDAVSGLAKHYHRSPDQLTKEMIEDYLLYLKNDKANAPNSCASTLSGLRFFYNHVSEQQILIEYSLSRKVQNLPTVLPQDDIDNIINATDNLKHRLILMTTYSAGLRSCEVRMLKPEHIESKKMLIKVEKGKGGKQRYTLLAKRLLPQLRQYYKTCRPKTYLFPSSYKHKKIVSDLINCRTAHLGGKIERCDRCGTLRIVYHSCRNRHCPKCQNMPRERWLEKRKDEILPVNYFHVVFTLPHELNTIILNNKKVMFNILFAAASKTLISFGENELNGTPGFLAILHTWDQKLHAHFHLHCIIAGRVVSKDDKKWIAGKDDYLFNQDALSLVFRGKFMQRMSDAIKNDNLKFAGNTYKKLKNTLFTKKWVVSVRDPVKQPEYVLEYLARYTHRVAIANSRIKALKDGMVTFTAKNRKKNCTELITISAVEFIRRFLLHSLPKRFVKIRHYGLLANRNRAKNLKTIRLLMGLDTPTTKDIAPLEEMMQKIVGIDITICPCCNEGKMHFFAEIPGYHARAPNSLVCVAG